MLASLRLGTLLCLAALVGVLVFTSYRGVDAREADGYRVLLRTLQREDHALSAELLRTAAGTVRHYDTLARRIKARKQLVEAARHEQSEMAAASRDNAEALIERARADLSSALDEATASVDNETEAAILESIAERKSQTTILVTHRLAAAGLADRILVLDEGCVIEQGTEKDLLKLNGVYAQLHERQRQRQRYSSNLSEEALV